MYTVENPAFNTKLSALELGQYGPRFTGVGDQILGADDRHDLILGNTFTAEKDSQPPNKEVLPQEFNKRVFEGFQVTPLWNQGSIHDDGRSNYIQTVKTAHWEYSTRPVYGWGNVDSKQKSTAGWLVAFPVFEPHWQICMASGLSTGWIEWDGELFEFQDAPLYSEKNWGGAFPRKWFWIGVHCDGIFYEFVPWNGVANWEIAPWGYWYMAAENETHMDELKATTTDPGTPIRAPTAEAGFATVCKDSCLVILDVTTDMAAVEVGGGPWFNTWKGKTASPEILNCALNLPVNVDGFFSLILFFKPPGL
ncbi:hypothetical protein Patl1_12908 [Pistacia atlantica]|uniref:Uncharacterized protein n=1 Tax=Pistacia atlantica TaxID=434234 RepID=A0ACC1AT31_9ROSI|nr:hypothetical protein Patl1_12908 [Pistacia atlantica]